MAGRRLRIDAGLPAPTVMAGGIGDVNTSQYRIVSGQDDRIGGRTVKPPYGIPSTAAFLAAPWNGLTHVSTFSGGGGTCLGFRLAGFRTLWANDVNLHARACYERNLGGPIDGTDIRAVTAAQLLSAIGLGPGELDVFEGSPPCVAFSTAGTRHRGWGRRKEHAGILQESVEDLFFEWLRLLDGLRPRAFMAENVPGLAVGVAKGYFKDILRRMKALGYRTEARLLDAQWLGVPQSRRRIVFVGVREDLGRPPAFLRPLPWRYSVREAVPWIAEAIHDVSGRDSVGICTDACAPAVLARRAGALHVRQIVGDDGFRPRFGSVDVPHPTIACSAKTSGRIEIQCGARPNMWRSGSGPSPAIMSGRRVDVRSDSDGRRKFSIAELKRVCAFPDDYQLVGSYARQWAVLGNSVPPLMAHRIAAAIRDGVFGGGRG